MDITLHLSDDLVHQLQQLSNPDEFVASLLKKALGTTTSQAQQQPLKLSRWAKIAERIENDPVHLEGYSDQLKQDMQDFRENFAFTQDK